VNPSVSPQSPTELELPIAVAVTLPLFEDFARAVGKENVVVLSLVPAGVDPHSYELTAGDVDRLRGVDFFFVNGLGLDRKIHEVIEARRDETAYVIPFAPNIRSPRGSELGNPELTAEHARDNAHLWLDPEIAAVYAELVADELIIYDGIREDFYTLNFSAYKGELLALVEEIEAQIQTIPAANRKLVTYHDSFAHFARKFGLEVVGSAVTDPAAQPAAADLDRLVQAVRDASIPAVFSEHGYDAAAMEVIASETGVEVCTLQSDILADESTTYIEMMRANVAELVRCLGGTTTQ
jgi:ABC-type Zn uptake system ZnuABC Zn-binding protein ZnuA